MTYICGNCGNLIDNLADCKHNYSEDGKFVYHLCPQCGQPGYHFHATKEIKAQQRDLSAKWLGSQGHRPSCAVCLAHFGLDRVEYATLETHDGWKIDSDDDYIEIRIQGRQYVAVARSLSLEDRVESGHVFWANIVKPGSFINPIRVWEMLSDDWNTLITQAQAEFERLETEFSQQVENKVAELKATAADKGYKPGWVWYRVKDLFGADIANEFLPK